MALYHTVEQGEHLASIAKTYHFSDYRIIYEHEKNKELRARRPDPNILLPGDTIFIPDKQTKEEQGSTETKHRFKVKAPKTMLRLIIKNEEDKPYQNEPYQLTINPGDSERKYKGTTNGEGLLKQEIPADAQDAYLAMGRLGLFWSLKIGHLDPVQEPAEGRAIISGVQARLNNLGYDCGPVSGELTPATQEAVKAFQQRKLQRSEPTGELDKETLDALNQEHAC